MTTPEILEVEPPGAFLLKHVNGGRNLTFYDNKDNLPVGWTQHELVLKSSLNDTPRPVIGNVDTVWIREQDLASLGTSSDTCLVFATKDFADRIPLYVSKPVDHEVVLELQKLLREQEARHKTELATYVNYPEYRDKNTMEKRIQALEKEVAFYRGCFEQMAVHPRSTTVELGPAGYYRLAKLALNGPPSESSEKTTPQE